MKLSTQLNYAGGFKEAVDQVVRAREGRARHGVGGRGLQLRRRQLDGLPGRPHRDGARSPSGILPIYTPHADADRDDRGRHRRPVRRPLHPRPRRLGSAGDRGLPRRRSTTSRSAAPARSSTSAARCGGASASSTTAPATRSRVPEGQGTGLGKPLKLINHPVRSEIPIYVASLGPKNVEMTAEKADGWLPLFYLPEKAKDVWGDDLAAGAAKRDAGLGPLEIVRRRPAVGRRGRRGACASSAGR